MQMVKKKEENFEEVVEEAKPEAKEEPKQKAKSPGDLKEAMLGVGVKLCDDLMNGKARDEKTALTAIVEIYQAVK